MSDEGERICPLCAEEMDLTDQQLKPCKCGYEICVWCWHHIIEMAAKQDTEGRCPACRTQYDKDMIVGMPSNCVRLVTETNGERKLRVQKAKTKSLVDARKHLSNVRVIQRNLVYIIGLPSSLSDENVLERKDFFGQYGKVLKVSITRATLGTQQGPISSNTFNVYITYAKEEEAVRCIQAVHNFILEGKQLRACFGTTKYCHAWLRNMLCSNPDCFYLHDVGGQEDSFTKDEIMSAYTRSRVPQITASSSQKRLGNVLPPPEEDFDMTDKAFAKSTTKSSCNNSASSVKNSFSNSNFPRSIALPAAASWGSRLSHSPYSTSYKVSAKEKEESPLIPMTARSFKQPPLSMNMVEKGIRLMDNEDNLCSSSKVCTDVDSRSMSNVPSDLDYGSHSSAWNDDAAALPSSKVTEQSLAVNPNRSYWSPERSHSCADRYLQKSSSASSPELAVNESILSSWDEDDTDDTPMLPKTIEAKKTMFLNETNILAEYPNSSINRDYESDTPHSLEGTMEPTCNSEIAINLSSHSPDEKGIVISKERVKVLDGYSRESEIGTGNELVEDANPEIENIQMLSDEVTSLSIKSAIEIHGKHTYKQESSSSSGHPLHAGLQELYSDVQINRLTSLSLKETLDVIEDVHPLMGTSNWKKNQLKQQLVGNEAEYSLETLDVTNVDDKDANLFIARQTPYFPYSTPFINVENLSRNLYEGDYPNTHLPGEGLSRNSRSTNILSSFIPDTGDQQLNVNFASKSNSKKVADLRESNIISNILSMDINPCYASSCSEISKILCETHKQTDALKFSSLMKGQNNNQSRFSFARMENHSNNLEPSHIENGFSTRNTTSLKHGFFVGNVDDSVSQLKDDSSLFPSNKNFVHPRANMSAKTSAPPGFSFPRVPPPGFSSPNRLDRVHETSAYQVPRTSISINQYQSPGSSGDVEFIDPTILAVGEGRMSAENHGESAPRYFMAQISAGENDRNHPLLQQTILQDRVINGFSGNTVLSSKDSYVPSQITSQTDGSLPHLSEMLPSPLFGHNTYSQWNG